MSEQTEAFQPSAISRGPQRTKCSGSQLQKFSCERIKGRKSCMSRLPAALGIFLCLSLVQVSSGRSSIALPYLVSVGGVITQCREHSADGGQIAERTGRTYFLGASGLCG